MKQVCMLPCWGPRGAHPWGTAAAPGSLAGHSQQTGHWSCLWWSWSPAGWCTCTDRPTGPSWSHQTPPPPPLYDQGCFAWQRKRAETEMLNMCLIHDWFLMVSNSTYLGPWPVDVLQVEIVVEVLSHARSVTQTLQDGVHVACVAHVTKTSQGWTITSKRRIQVANFGSRRPHNLDFGIDFSTGRSAGQRSKIREYQSSSCRDKTKGNTMCNISKAIQCS